MQYDQLFRRRFRVVVAVHNVVDQSQYDLRLGQRQRLLHEVDIALTTVTNENETRMGSEWGHGVIVDYS